MKLIGFTIFVEDIKAATAYYKNLFGIAPVSEDENSCAFNFGEIRYFLHKKNTWEQGMPPNDDHIEFVVEDLGKEINSLKQKGVTVEIEPKQYYWGKSAYLRDPDGRFIELTEK